MTLSPYSFEPDLNRARTLPADWYTQPDALPLDRERVFARTWQFACALNRLRTPGSFASVEVCGWPIVLTRDTQGVLRAFHNVCRHRAGVVARGDGCRKTLQCEYHGWLYGLDGTLKHTPEFNGFDGAIDFDHKQFGLVPIRVETWADFAFVNIQGDAPSLKEYLGAIPDETADLNLTELHLIEKIDYFINANWKVYIDNYLEGYHVPVAHPGLYREIDYQEYRVDTFRYYSSQYAPIRAASGSESDRVYASVADQGQALYYWIFPNFMLNIYPGILQLNVIIPLSYDRTLTVFEWYAADPRARASLDASIAFSEQVQQEDIRLCEDVWKNLQAGVYTQGRYCPRRENGVHHFHGLLTEFLTRG